MAKYTRKEVLEEAKQLAAMLAHTEEIERFKQLEAQVNNHENLQKMIKALKTLQKQAVNLQAYEKMEALKKVEEEIERLQNEIDAIPVVQEFKENQIVVNDVLQLVTGTIAREITNSVIEATGGDLMSGKTGKQI
ncbi:RicAFT regulatory complex protein RicA family protein [Ornithinibacillus sp. 4-3]|uniref:RicAFT regulatory complex protein RicA family protein n=1 Tax=Ornithinibacillus sp. 4-3 TaxID=3231488 RepID=A0AB39HWT8_9BACI